MRNKKPVVLDYSVNLGYARNGRPPLYDTPEELDTAVCLYFANEQATNRRPTLAGLALFLGFADKQSIYDQEKRGEGFSYVIKRARTAIEHALSQGTVAMDIFLLKSPFWPFG